MTADESQGQIPRIIPHSPALAEAGPGGESLSDLMSRDPTGWTQADEDRVLEAIRAQRERWAALEASGQTRAGAKRAPLAKSTSLSAEDIGI